MKTALMLVPFAMAGISTYFIFFDSEIVLGAVLSILAGGVDYALTRTSRKLSK
jgi:hypothetical protein